MTMKPNTLEEVIHAMEVLDQRWREQDSRGNSCYAMINRERLVNFARQVIERDRKHGASDSEICLSLMSAFKEMSVLGICYGFVRYVMDDAVRSLTNQEECFNCDLDKCERT